MFQQDKIQSSSQIQGMDIQLVNTFDVYICLKSNFQDQKMM